MGFCKPPPRSSTPPAPYRRARGSRRPLESPTLKEKGVSTARPRAPSCKPPPPGDPQQGSKCPRGGRAPPCSPVPRRPARPCPLSGWVPAGRSAVAPGSGNAAASSGLSSEPPPRDPRTPYRGPSSSGRAWRGSRSSSPALPGEPGSPSPPVRRGRSAPGSRGPRRSSPRSPVAPRWQPQRLRPPQIPARAPRQRPEGQGLMLGMCRFWGSPAPLLFPAPAVPRRAR